jgi:hypothetical protein
MMTQSQRKSRLFDRVPRGESFDAFGHDVGDVVGAFEHAADE